MATQYLPWFRPGSPTPAEPLSSPCPAAPLSPLTVGRLVDVSLGHARPLAVGVGHEYAEGVLHVRVWSRCSSTAPVDLSPVLAAMIVAAPRPGKLAADFSRNVSPTLVPAGRGSLCFLFVCLIFRRVSLTRGSLQEARRGDLRTRKKTREGPPSTKTANSQSTLTHPEIPIAVPDVVQAVKSARIWTRWLTLG